MHRAATRQWSGGSLSRFSAEGGNVLDTRSGLMWPADSALSEFPLDWSEALALKSPSLDASHAFSHVEPVGQIQDGLAELVAAVGKDAVVAPPGHGSRKAR